MEMFVHILCNFDAVLKFNENTNNILTVATVESLSNQIDLEIRDISNFTVNVYPISKQQKNLFSYAVDFECGNETISSKSEYVSVYNLPENHYLLIFKPLCSQTTDIIADKIEVKDKEVRKLSLLNDLAGRAKIEVFKQNTKELKKDEEYFVYVGEHDERETSPDLIILAFFEALIAKDFTTCLSYISSDFAKKINKETLQNYFGSPQYCIINNFYSVPSIILIYENESKVFSANIINERITDIYEIN